MFDRSYLTFAHDQPPRSDLEEDRNGSSTQSVVAALTRGSDHDGLPVSALQSVTKWFVTSLDTVFAVNP